MYRIGVDLGGTNIAVGVTGEDFSIAASAHTPTRPERGAQAVIGDICGCIENALMFSGIDIGECAGIGIGSPGTCDRDSGTVRQAFNLGWRDVELTKAVSDYFSLPAFLDNDGNCAALGETLAGAARGCRDVIMIVLGTGVGGGVIANGQICSGWRGLGGEMGHMCISMDGEPCSCGQRGCWEAYASVTALIRQAGKAAKLHPDSLLAAAPVLDGLSIYDAMHRGDAAAKAVTDEYARYVAVGITNLINCFYPEMVIIGGGVSRQGEALLGPVREYAAQHFFVGDRALLPRIAAAGLGGDAGVIGAAALVKTD